MFHLIPGLLAEPPSRVKDEAVEDDEDGQRDPVVADDQGSVEHRIFQELDHALARTLKRKITLLNIGEKLNQSNVNEEFS